MTFDALVVEAKRTGGDLTDAQAEELVEQTLATGRSGLNEAEFVRVRSYLDSNTDDGPALFASKGTAVIDDPVGAAKFRAACFNSFGSDTLVVRADGTRVRIADLMPGERLLTWDIDAGLAGSGVVTASLSHAAPFGELVLGDGSALSVTANHVVFDAGSGSWVEVGDLLAGATMATASGGLVGVDGYTASTAHGVVWDITVADAHNYFVAATGTSDAVLVHNADELCSEPLTLDAFTQLFDFRAASDVAVNDGLADVFASAYTVASIKGLDQAGYEGMLNRLARLANEEPDVLRELAVRPVWLESAFYAGPGNFEKLIDAAVGVPTLRLVSDDAAFALALRPQAQFDSILGSLSSVERLSSPKPERLNFILSKRVDAGEILEAMGETPIEGAVPVLAGKLNEPFFDEKPFLLGSYLDEWMRLRSVGSSAFSPFQNTVSGLVSSLPQTPPVLSPVWVNVIARDRGVMLEEYLFVLRQPLGLNTYSHRFYPIIDDFRGGVATQLKTVDFATSYQDVAAVSGWQRNAITDLRKLATVKAEGIDQQVVNGIVVGAVEPEAVNILRFDIVMTPSLAADPVVAAAQEAALQAVFDEGQTLGVEVRFAYAN